MAGDEEARARAVLMDMQSRLAQGPQSALGLGAEVSPELVRGAFLQLTKQFHPARFGRMSTEIQRLSNEVFLGLRSAHDSLQKSLGSLRAKSEGSGAMHVIAAEGTAKTSAPISPRGTASIPRLGSPGGQPPAPTSAQNEQLARGTDRAASPPLRAPTPVAQRATTPALGVAIRPGTPPGTPPTTARAQTPAPAPSGLPRPGSPGSSGTLPTQRPGTPPQRAITPAQRAGTPPARASTPSQPPPTRDSTAKISTGQTQPLPKAAPAFDERLALREALMSLNEKNWSAAKTSLNTLAVKVPHSKHYRALLCYARGREAQAANRGDEALLEFQRALELDPQLDLAKQAAAELTRRR